MTDEYIAANRELWNNWTRSHETSDFYDVAGFKAGRNTLNPTEIEEVGSVVGKSLLHLQCHFGQDTLSWARRGASVTGADLSDESITLAQRLAAELNIPAHFVRANLYDLPAVLDEQFDIVYTSAGALYWLPEIAKWGAIVARYLKPSGIFYVHEQHPLSMIFEELEGKLEPTYSYWTEAAPLRFETHGSYAGPSDYKGVEYGWTHALGEIVTALTRQGLHIEFLHEWPYTFFRAFPSMTQDEQGRWWLPNRPRHIPMSFSIRATKPS